MVASVGCTMYIQAPDVFWNKHIESGTVEFNDEYLAQGVHQYSRAGNLKVFPRRLVVTWVLQACSRLSFL